MNSLKEGLELAAIYFFNAQENIETIPFIVDKNCKRIIVSMENGQMSQIPWAIVDTNIMINLAFVEMIEIKGEQNGS